MAVLSALTDRIIYPAPNPSYVTSDFPGCLCWIPWNDAIPRPAGAVNATMSPVGGGEPVTCGALPMSSAWRRRRASAPVVPAADGAPVRSSSDPPPTGPKNFASEFMSHGSNKDQEDCLARRNPSAPAFWLPSLWIESEGSAMVLMYFHANAEDLGLVHSALRHLQRQLQVSVFAMEYPGYGVLKGQTEPSEDGICNAALCALRYLVDVIGVGYPQIILLGRSLGSGPAVYLASKFPVGGLLLVNAFSSLRAVAESHLGWPLANMAFQDIFVNERRIQNISCPVLFVHAARDKMVPTEHSAQLYDRCRASRKLLITPDRMEHNSHLFADPAFLAVPAIHFFHFPSYRTEKPPKLPKHIFQPPATRQSGGLEKDGVFPKWLCTGSAHDEAHDEIGPPATKSCLDPVRLPQQAPPPPATGPGAPQPSVKATWV